MRSFCASFAAVLAAGSGCGGPHRAARVEVTELAPPPAPHVVGADVDAGAPREGEARPSLEAEPAFADVAGFVVYSKPAALAHPRRKELLSALAVHLADLAKAFPLVGRDELRVTPIWLTERTTGGPFFHPSAPTLPFPEAANAIEIANIDETLAALYEGQPGMFAPLLAAGWLMNRWPDKLAGAERAYANAKAKSLPTAAFGNDGLTWFAKMSAAWFGRSPGVPPDRGRLRAADPEGAAFIANVWPRDELPTRPTATEAETRMMHGFTVLVEKRALRHPETTAALAKLDATLAEVDKAIPKAALATVQKAAVIVMRWADDPEGARQLWSHGGMIDILDPRPYLASLKRDPYAVVHEMAHAYAGARRELAPAIAKAFAAARAARLYQWLKHSDGHWGRAYAASNENEYFAELSMTYLMRGAWFPFTRADLEKHDPEGFRVVAEAWK